MKRQDHNVIVLVEFALALMTILDQINKESFQRFKLRIGESLETGARLFRLLLIYLFAHLSASLHRMNE